MVNEKDQNIEERCRLCQTPLTSDNRSKNDPELCQYCGEDKAKE
ncbi:MAG TPA: hypothetical protein VGA49_03355 [Patescibacteria group bacterium]